MKKKLLAIICMLAVLVGIVAVAVPTGASAATGNTYLVGYGKKSIDPIDPDGTYRNTAVNAVIEKKIAAAKENGTFCTYNSIVDANGKYVVPTYTNKTNASATPAGYFRVPLGGYGDDRVAESKYVDESCLSIGKMDDNGDGVINTADGLFTTAITVTDAYGNTMVFVAMDAIAANATVCDTARARIYAELGIPACNIVINASHSHSAPDMGVRTVSFALEENAVKYEANAPVAAAQEAYNALVIDRITEAVTEAYGSHAAATITKKSAAIGNNMNHVRHYKVTRSVQAQTRTWSWGSWRNSGSATTETYYSGDNFGGPFSGTTYVEHSSTSRTAYTVTSAQSVSKVDDTMYMLEINYENNAQDPILLANWRAHPKCNSTGSSTYGNTFRLYSSADYVNAFRCTLEASNYRVSFYQAAAGNVNTYSSLSGQTNADSIPSKYYSEAGALMTNSSSSQVGYAYGNKLASLALSTVINGVTAEPISAGVIQVAQSSYSDHHHVYSEGLVAAVAAYDAGTNKSFPYVYKHTDGKYYNLNSKYHANAIRSRGTAEKNVVLGLNAITIGDDLAFVTAPNELYDRYDINGSVADADNDWNELTDLGTNTYNFGTPYVLAYTNNTQGYIPNALACSYNANSSTYGTGSYEANTSYFTAGAGEGIIDTYGMLLDGLYASLDSLPARCEACNKEVEWTALAGVLSNTTIPAGHYYLAADVAASTNWQKQISGKVCLYMNGHTYANQSTPTGKAFVITSGGTLNIMGEGKVQGQGVAEDRDKNGGVIQIASGGTLNLYDATIERIHAENQLANYGGVVCVGTGGTFNMHSGTVTGGSVVKSAASGLGGNIYVAGAFNMEGGTVSGGTAETYGDNVCVMSTGTFSMSGGKITGGVYVMGANNTVTLSGSPVIAGGTKNLILANDGSKELNVSNLSEGAEIYVTGVRSLADAAYIDYIKPDEGTYFTTLGSKIFAGDRYTCECGGKAAGKYGHTCTPIVWAPWPGTGTPPTSGNYYLSHNINASKQIGVAGTLHLDLNGKHIIHEVAAENTTATRVFYLDGSDLLTITDTVGGGYFKRDLSNLTETELASINYSGMIVGMGGNATFRLYDGKLDGQGQTATAAGGTIAGTVATNTIQIYGGEVIGCVAISGGCLFNNGTTLLCGGTFTGGRITGSSGGGGVYVGGTLTLTGDATVTGNYAADGTTLSNIRCSASKLTVKDTYVGTAGIIVSSPAVGKVVGISSNADISGAALTVDNEPLYEIVTSGTQLKLATSKNAVVKQTNGNDVEYYETVEQAIQDYQGGDAYLTLMEDAAAVTLTVPTKIDLAGYDIAEVTLDSEGSLILVDSATDDFTVEDSDGYGTVPASANATAADGYILITEDEKTSAHRLDLTLTGLTLRPSVTGLYYRGQFGGDEVIKKHITDYGISLRANAAPDETYITEDTDNQFRSCYSSDRWLTGKITEDREGQNGVILSGIMKEDNGYVINKRNAAIPVYGVAYAIVDGKMILGQDRNFTLRQFFEAANAQYEKFDETGKNNLRGVYEQYALVMRTWDIGNITALSFAGKTATFVGDSITYGAKVSDGEQWWRHVTADLKLGNVANMGVSGSCISDNNDRGHNYQPLMDRYKNIPGTDLIFIFMGTNDFGHNTMITTDDYNATYHTDETRTLAVDLNTVIDYLQEQHPESEIILVTPIARHTATENAIGHTLQDYVDAVKAVAQTQGILVADIYDTTVSQMPLATHFDSDKVHPNALGHEVLGGIITAWLRENRETIFG